MLHESNILELIFQHCYSLLISFLHFGQVFLEINHHFFMLFIYSDQFGFQIFPLFLFFVQVVLSLFHLLFDLVCILELTLSIFVDVICLLLLLLNVKL